MDGYGRTNCLKIGFTHDRWSYCVRQIHGFETHRIRYPLRVLLSCFNLIIHGNPKASVASCLCELTQFSHLPRLKCTQLVSYQLVVVLVLLLTNYDLFRDRGVEDGDYFGERDESTNK